MSAVMLASCTASAEAPSEQSSAEETAAAVTESETEDTAVSSEASDTTDITESGADTLVVVFSCTGTTKGVADRIADVTDADLYEIVPAVPYTEEDRDWNDDNSRCTVEQNDAGVRPEIGSDPIDLDGYEVIFIGYPIWFGEEPRIMDTFVESYDFGDATVIPFCTSGSSGIGESGANMQALAPGSKVAIGERFKGRVSEDELAAWASTFE
jgi:flavodoxin